MVTDQYSHILDESRVSNARLLQDAFYERKGSEARIDRKHEEEKPKDPVAEQAKAAGVDPAVLLEMLSNPQMASMIQMLAKSLDGKK